MPGFARRMTASEYELPWPRLVMSVRKTTAPDLRAASPELTRMSMVVIAISAPGPQREEKLS